MRQLYEEEATARGDVLFKVYNGVAQRKKAQVPFWAVYFLRLKQLWLGKILSQYVKKNYSVLDLGCGPGYLSSKFINGEPRIYGVDISFHYLKIAKNKNNSYNFIQADISRLPFKDKSFDILVCSEVLEHVTDPAKALLEIKRVTRRLFISTVPIMPRFLDCIRIKMQKDKIFTPGNGHIRNFQVSSYLVTLCGNGFKVKVVQGMGFLWWFFSWCTPRKISAWGYIVKADALLSNISLLRPLILDVGVIAES